MLDSIVKKRTTLSNADSFRNECYELSGLQLRESGYGETGKWIRIFMLILMALLPWSSFAATEERNSNDIHRIVVLNATDPYLPAFIELEKSVRETIKTEMGRDTELYAETLDMHRFPRSLLVNDVVALLRKKYDGLKIDVVITVAPIALDFARKYAREIWPHAKIVFNSVPVESLGKIGLEPGITGIPIRHGFADTLDLALKLRPLAKKVAIVAGTAEPDRRHVSLVMKAVESYTDRIAVLNLVGLSLDATLQAVRELPDDAVVLYLTMFRDGDNLPHIPRVALELIAEASPVPVFGAFETYFGHGILAGSVTSYADEGKRTGELVSRILKGEDPSSIAVSSPMQPKCVADWQQLGRWGIDESLVPSVCDIHFRELTVWDRYSQQILAAAIFILVQSALILVLLHQRQKLRKAQAVLLAETEKRTRAESMARRLRARLESFSKERGLGVMASTIAHEINQPLISIQNYAQAARRRLQGDLGDTPKLIELSQKIEKQAERAGEIIQRVRSLISRKEPRLSVTTLKPMIDEVIGMLEQEAESRNCHILTRFVDDIPPVLADALQVQLVLVNLLKNAMSSVCNNQQYDRHVSIEVNAIDNREVLISVQDKGGGIPPELEVELFEPLSTGSIDGMGMGLAVSSAIIESHGGRIWYEPDPSGGAIFRFTLQAAKT